ncbi:hypothetical protein CEXT_352371 [Caerostris extrusa]|uniref:Uncharacterized protein n=1 Tax=Caerostris extrusa TaxID=172846 RepID=A0AAV4UB31_CAEEX|nr:hypothetical protein CEXT_352371 [Caerostris extrusa]
MASLMPYVTAERSTRGVRQERQTVRFRTVEAEIDKGHVKVSTGESRHLTLFIGYGTTDSVRECGKVHAGVSDKKDKPSISGKFSSSSHREQKKNRFDLFYRFELSK